jgi:hypothetical protein
MSVALCGVSFVFYAVREKLLRGDEQTTSPALAQCPEFDVFDRLPAAATERAKFGAGMGLTGFEQEPGGNEHTDIEAFFACPMFFEFQIAMEQRPLVLI